MKKLQGNYQEDILFSIVVNKKGKEDRMAIDIYSDLKGWFKPSKEGKFNKSGKFDITKYGLRTSYEALAKKHNTSKENIRQKLVLLESLGLINRSFRIEYIAGRRHNNVLHILLWKITPHFCSEIGLEKTEVFNANLNKKVWDKVQEESASPTKKMGVVPPREEGGSLQENLDIIYSDIDITTLNTTINTDTSIDIDTHLNHKTEIEYYYSEKPKTQDQQNQFKNVDSAIVEEAIDINVYLNWESEPENRKSYLKALEEKHGNNQHIQNVINDFKPLESEPCVSSKDLMYEVLASMKPKVQATPPTIQATVQEQTKAVGKVYNFKIPLREYKLNQESFDTLRRLSNKPHFTDDRIRAIIRNIIENNPNTMIFGRKKAFTNYMVKALNGESEYTEKEKAESVADRERKEYERMRYNYENRIIVWG